MSGSNRQLFSLEDICPANIAAILLSDLASGSSGFSWLLYKHLQLLGCKTVGDVIVKISRSEFDIFFLQQIVDHIPKDRDIIPRPIVVAASIALSS